MKAHVLHGIGDIRLDMVKEPIPQEREVLVAVKAAGICGSDIARIFKTGAYSHPLIPGHEFAGEVVALGAGADEGWLGKRVGVFPLIPCHECEPCRQQHYELCRSYSYLGSRRDGGFAEYVAVPVDNLLELPEGVSYEEAAMLEPMAVAVHAMRRTAWEPEKPVAVCGLGTIGLLLAMFLQEAGAQKLLVIGNKDFQRETVQKMGISSENFCDMREQDVNCWLKERTASLGVHTFFECVGKNETLQQALENTAPNGNVMLVGNPYSDMSLDKATYWKILRNQLSLSGTWNSSFTHSEEDDWNYVLKRLEQRRICPERFITHLLQFEELPRGLNIMKDKTEDYVKVMLKR